MVAGHGPLRLPDLLRLLRLYGHRPRRGQAPGIDLLLNFNLPYFSRGPGEFWRRWHISLSSWLRDYLYFPLGGNRAGNARTYRNLMITMVLGGLWHGAAWNFVLWGFYQGAVLCLYRAIQGDGKPAPDLESSGPGRAGWIRFVVSLGVFFAFTCYGWLLFRANSFGQIASFTRTLFLDFGNLAMTLRKPPLAAMLGLPVLLFFECLEYCGGRADALPLLARSSPWRPLRDHDRHPLYGPEQ